MRHFSVLLVGISLLTLSDVCVAQSEKKEADTDKPVRGLIQYQLVKTNGSEIFIEQNLADRSVPKVTQTYTVMVPVRESKLVDGKEVQVVKYITEERTRERYKMVRKSRPMPAGYRFKDIKGNKITRKELIGKLGMGSGKMLVQIFPGQKISAEMKSLLRDDVIFMIADQVKPVAAPAVIRR